MTGRDPGPAAGVMAGLPPLYPGSPPRLAEARRSRASRASRGSRLGPRGGPRYYIIHSKFLIEI